MRVRGATVVRSAGAVCAAAGGLLWLQAGVQRAIYPAPTPGQPIVPPPGFEHLERPSGAHVLYSPAPDGAPTLILLHGNGTDITEIDDLLGQLRDAGFGVAAIEYPGYGPSPSVTASERTIAAGCEEALRYLADTHELGQVVLVGHSLGTAFAIDLAAKGFGDRLVVVAGFTSARALARHLTRWIPWQTLLGAERLDNLSKAPSVDLPTLVVHGTADTVIPVEMGRELAAAFPRAQLVEYADADHESITDHLVESALRALTLR